MCCVGDATWVLWMWVDSGAMPVGAFFLKSSTAFTFTCRFFPNVCNLLMTWLWCIPGCSHCWKMCVLSAVRYIFELAWVWWMCCVWKSRSLISLCLLKLNLGKCAHTDEKVSSNFAVWNEDGVCTLEQNPRGIENITQREGEVEVCQIVLVWFKHLR